MMWRSLVAMMVLVGVASAIQCNSCDSFMSCTRPFPVQCPPHSKCYSLVRNGEMVAKGCAHACESLSYLEGSQCQLCHHMDFCNNDEPRLGQGVVLRQPPPPIGGGVQPDNGHSFLILVQISFRKINNLFHGIPKMIVGAPDDREVIRQTIGQIRDLYKEIVNLRNEDRQKYKEMCARLEALEKEKSRRLRHRARARKSAQKPRSKVESKNTASSGSAPGGGAGSAGLPKKTASKNLKVETGSSDGTTKTDEKGQEKEE